MVHPCTYKIKTFLSTIIVIFLSLSLFSQKDLNLQNTTPSSISYQSDFIRTINSLEKINVANANEQVYLHTNGEVYNPGDTIWYKAYIRTKALLVESDLSRVFYIFLTDEYGKIIDEVKTYISNSYSEGYMLVSREAKEGKYYLYGYSSWMKNFKPEHIYRKRISIINKTEIDYRLVPHFSKNSYLPGDSVKIIVKKYDKENETLKSSRFRYQLLYNDNEIARGVGRSTEEEPFPINMLLPDSISGKPVLHIWDDFKNELFDLPFTNGLMVDFFPEGGNSLVGKMGHIAFKAVYENGTPASIVGDIVNEKGEIFTTIITDHQGMGKFALAPEKDNNYFLHVTNPLGFNNLYPLPKGETDAMAIHAQISKEKINVEINNNLEKFDTCLFVITIRGYFNYYRLITSESKAAFSIPTDSLPAGIAVLTLFNKENIPLSERLIFVNYDQFVNSELQTNHKQYLCRDSVKLQISMNTSDPNFEKGSYSLSVVDDLFSSSKLIDEPNIISSNYLAPEIRGEIIDPNYYFQSQNPKAKFVLDLLLMTQGWRKYSILEKIEQADTLKQPENADVIKGRMEEFKFGRNPVSTKGEIQIYFAGNSESISTDDLGNFSFYPEYSNRNTSSILISAQTPKGSDKVYLFLNDEDYRSEVAKYITSSIDSVVKDNIAPTFLFEDINRNMRLNPNKSIWLDEVEITKNLDEEYEEIENLSLTIIKNMFDVRSAPEGSIESSLEIRDIIEQMGYICEVNDEDLLTIFIRGGYVPVKFIIDGIEPIGQDYTSLSMDYKPYVIKNIYVAKGVEAQAIYSSAIIVYIQTDPLAYRLSLGENKYSNSKTIKNLQVIKEFYSPQYRTEEEKNIPEPDLRKTLYWNPDIKLDEDGKGTVTFFNADRLTKVKCVLEGFTDTGMPVYGEAYYNISIYRE